MSNSDEQLDSLRKGTYCCSELPLIDALVQAGIPRDKIILAFAGEPVPETA
ncbi:MAG: hypothetical protein U0528_14555 [Anaerolineae bacterium]|nr:hypothetical protein [Anaerolineae bacterium]